VRRWAEYVARALGVVILLDVLRVWLPSIITIFGQAASTPAELMGAFALAWFVAGFAAPALAARIGPARLGLAAAVVLGVARLALFATDGGQPQLYVAGVGLLAGICWLVSLAMAPPAYAVPTVAGGLALAGLQHAALGTVDLTWRGGVWPWLVGAAAVGVFLAYGVRQPSRMESPLAPAGWLLVGPAILLSGMITNSPALARITGDGDMARSTEVLAVTALPALLLLYGAVSPARQRWWPIVCGLVLVGSVTWFSYGPGGRGLLLAGAIGLGGCLGWSASGERGSPARHGYALAGGMLIMGAAATVYYAAYDLGYPNGWVPVLVALLVAAQAIRTRASVQPATPPWPALAGVALALAALGVWWTVPAVQEKPDAQELRVVAYNIRMGYGLDGTFKPDVVARAIAAERPDVVLLSEVDRAWLLNGGHDDLEVLARRLDMRYVFGPAADDVWGDAILTNLPVVRVERRALSSDGAVTGAQALGAIVRVGDVEVAVVSTHLQPPPDGPPLVQAREVTTFAAQFGGTRPTVVGGDLNISPDSESFGVLTGAGFADMFAAVRPFPTFPSDVPEQEIDHVLARGFTGSAGQSSPRVTASDHALIAVTLVLQ
jgi:endonuclease/exonuclease/phosphatase family metal-dependent hydrolase